MDEPKAARVALILFPQSTIGKSLLYLIFGSKVAMYVFRAFTLPDGTLTADPSIVPLVGMLMDIATGFGANLPIMWLVRWILVKLGVLKVSENHHIQFKRFFATMAAIAIVLVIAIPITVRGGFSLKREPSSSITGVDALSSEEKARFREIATGVMQGQDALTKEVHAEFWVLMTKMGIRGKSQVDQFKDVVTGVSSKYQRYLWEDARQALRQGRAFKSLQRDEYEKHLKNLGLLSDFRIRENEEFVNKIAKKKPLPVQGQNVVITDPIIKETLANLAEVTKRLDQLFTP